MEKISTLFIVTFTTLLAMINPLEALPIFLKLLEGKDKTEHRNVARRSCIYATSMMLFFLVLRWCSKSSGFRSAWSGLSEE